MRIFDRADKNKSVDVDWLLKRIDKLEVAMVELSEKVARMENPPVAKQFIIRPAQNVPCSHKNSLPEPEPSFYEPWGPS